MNPIIVDSAKAVSYTHLDVYKRQRELSRIGIYEAKIYLAAGLPLTWVRTQREHFREYLMRNKTVDFKFNGSSFHIEFVGCSVYPQGYPAVVEFIKEFKGTNILADIGNGTMNILYIRNKKPIESSSWTEKLGVNQLVIKMCIRDRVSAWWNPDGMRISYGDTAIGKGHLLSWEQIDKRISELLELGRFAPQETLDKINQYERSKAASAFWYMERDLNYDEYPDLHDLFKKEWFDGGYPDSTGRITEMFKQPEVLNELISVTNTLAQKYGEDKRIMRFKMYSPDKVLSLLRCV